MRLLVSAIPYDGGKSGISTYVREVVKALHAEGHELTILVEPDGIAESELSKYGKPVRAPKWTRPAPLSMLWHLFILPFWIRWHRGEFDAMVICAANRRVCARYPLATAATVHDLANFHVKGKYSRSRMFYLAKILPHYAMKAQRLVAVSAATKADMVKYWGAGEDEVTVLYNGLPALPPPSETGGKNLLYISRIEHPGKNHVRLIEAYGKLPKDLASAHPLVLAGADWKDADPVHDAAKASPYADLIRFTGFVPENGMEKLWAEAGYYVFPSLFEGFGLTLAEAMARGVPSASSNNGSLGEIAADAAITFDPNSVDDIAKAIEKLLSLSAEEKEGLIAKGKERAKAFSWLDHARGLERILSGTRPPKLFGIAVAPLSEDEAVAKIVSLAEERRGKKAAFVATLNVDFVSNAVSGWPFGGNDELWDYLKNADFVTADGMPIVLLAKMLGKPLKGRVTGADMVPAILKECEKRGLSVYVLGGDSEIVRAAIAKLNLPELKLAGVDPAFIKLGEEDPAIVGRINAAKPDILFVALGNPKQELWMGRHLCELAVGVAMGIGGTFNFLAGKVKRAPKWMQKAGLEWIYRIIQEPGRLWRRYAYGLVKFSWLSLRHLFGGYRK